MTDSIISEQLEQKMSKKKLNQLSYLEGRSDAIREFNLYVEQQQLQLRPVANKTLGEAE